FRRGSKMPSFDCSDAFSDGRAVPSGHFCPEVMAWCYARKVERGCGSVFVSFAVVLCAGCGPDVEVPVDCDADGPVELVQIDAPARSIWRAWGRRDERGWVFAESDEEHGYVLPAGGVADARGIAVE